MKNYLTLFLLFLSQISFSQKEKDKPTIFNKHKYEVGIDFKHAFSRYDAIGTSLVFKKRIGEKKYISINEKRALRFNLSINGTVPLNNFNKYEVNGLTFFELQDFIGSNINISASVGLEKQRQVKRVQYFYGLDLSLSYAKRKELGTNGTSTYNVEIRKGFGTALAAFGGVKFFFSPEFSISLESAFFAGIGRYKLDVDVVDYVSKTNTVTNYQAQNKINFNLVYLRTLNLSYYF